MSGDDVRAADELEALRQLKARYCRILDTKDVESWRGVFTTDVANQDPALDPNLLKLGGTDD